MSHLSLSEQINAELLAILIEEEVTYPWDVTAVEGNDPLDVTKTPFSLCEGLEATGIEAQAHRFFSSLHQTFPTVSLSSQSNILDKFACLLPAEHLNRLVESAENLVNSQLDNFDRLVVCLSELFPQWSPEDLEVFARPYAYTMRNGQSKTTIDTEDWQSLSEIEQIRRSAAIASQIFRDLSSPE
ncbi:MAG: hypothetical protein EWV53_01355 [Microcystis panniformis Mp_MB_F_20051200_S9]|uniref:Uncharacterized protein n=1 Tax=Microcystis panniformis Mp_MB_F_20051200_S9 TaxID=2486223 RepID=A0A552QAK1_9CHRO|nr:MAG: hypothetical protein EWV43_11315 [Microcystis panniformis Mp_MB_F_20080800_S26D]TRV52628.1 MAG: hypothetical protein EWV87_04565 [Microcystis panniformis Mp_GB_SS_20050300_S99]TRV52962.1 MAG: hypothetical protein EWV42_07130 [Microcystis panniformis Mp_GB_SS_20050300_S99D]TRV56915.1 MAG: hypothetical protein EWV69_17075 [Microcystis panniformis Mp_MB_F_20080800_S26]TRV57869.1 MAG: hypothetical protein EWV86_20315 [Microcystis panniformis Mp_MB_F_20051200_S9D]TRV66250.1 MAG: hypothetica